MRSQSDTIKDLERKIVETQERERHYSDIGNHTAAARMYGLTMGYRYALSLIIEGVR